MQIFSILFKEIISFFGINHWLEMARSNDYSSLLTLNGILSSIGPLIPLLLIIEMIRAKVYKRFKIDDYKVPLLVYVANRVIGQFISIGATAFCIGLFEKYALIKTTNTWYWFLYSYVAWELSHFVYHYLGHRVRLFWCLHSTHHAPQQMNLSVTYAHFFLEAPYANVIRTSICILLGVNPPMLFLIMAIDGTWGAFIHVGENLIRDGRLGFLNKIILTPSHHRVHHAKNPLYMDTNFCNLLNIWDRAFGTFQDEQTTLPIQYGITRPINSTSFWDVYFGEIALLGRDVAKAPGIWNKLLYIVMPPGWSHTGLHSTAAVIKKKMKDQDSIVKEE